jgi:hypothetical protein
VKVLYVGNFSQTWHTESHVAKDLEASGHQVQRVTWMKSRADYDDDVDVVIVQGGGLPDGEPARTWIKSWHVPTIAYHLDVYAGLPRADVVGRDAWWNCDFVCTADGSPQMDALCEALDIKHRWLPGACLSSECVPGEWRAEYAHDVVFVGGGYNYPHVREWPWRQELVNELQRRYGDRFGLYPTAKRGRIHGRDLNDLYASSRVVVGDSLLLPGMKNYWSDRYYETVGRGGFLVAPDVPGIAAHFTDGEHLRLYTDHRDSVFELVDRYLDAAAARHRISHDGQAHVLAHHTYKQRGEQLLGIALNR